MTVPWSNVIASMTGPVIQKRIWSHLSDQNPVPGGGKSIHFWFISSSCPIPSIYYPYLGRNVKPLSSPTQIWALIHPTSKYQAIKALSTLFGHVTTIISPRLAGCMPTGNCLPQVTPGFHIYGLMGNYPGFIHDTGWHGCSNQGGFCTCLQEDIGTSLRSRMWQPLW